MTKDRSEPGPMVCESERTSMNSYIVRIYREEKDNPRNFVGTVENVEAGGKSAFTTLDELWAILNSAGKETERKAKRDRGRA